MKDLWPGFERHEGKDPVGIVLVCEGIEFILKCYIPGVEPPTLQLIDNHSMAFYTDGWPRILSRYVKFDAALFSLVHKLTNYRDSRGWCMIRPVNLVENMTVAKRIIDEYKGYKEIVAFHRDTGKMETVFIRPEEPPIPTYAI